MVEHWANTNSTICNDIASGCDWKLFSDFNIDSEQTNANDNKCFFTQFGCVGHIAGSTVYAIHIDWNFAAKFRVWRIYV